MTLTMFKDDLYHLYSELRIHLHHALLMIIEYHCGLVGPAARKREGLNIHGEHFQAV